MSVQQAPILSLPALLMKQRLGRCQVVRGCIQTLPSPGGLVSVFSGMEGHSRLVMFKVMAEDNGYHFTLPTGIRHSVTPQSGMARDYIVMRTDW